MMGDVFGSLSTPSNAQAYTYAALDLARDSLDRAGQLRLQVVGNSMLPFLRPGDIVWLEPAEEQNLRRGDLVVLRYPAYFLTHRLVEPGSWLTKGDNLRVPDPRSPDVIWVGRVTAIRKENGNRILSMQSRRWKTVNLMAGHFGWWEAYLFRLLNRYGQVVRPVLGKIGLAKAVKLLCRCFYGVLFRIGTGYN